MKRTIIKDKLQEATAILMNMALLWTMGFAVVFATTLQVAAQEINIKGNNLSVFDGSVSPKPNNHTYFGRVKVSGGTIEKTFIIENSGTGDLILNGVPSVSITGTHAADFTVTVQPTSPI